MKLAYLTTQFPFWPGEQFFEPEVRGLSRLAELVLVPIRPRGTTLHYHGLGAQALGGGLFDPRVLWAAFRELLDAPSRVASAFAAVAFGRSSLRARIVNLVVFPKALAFARDIRLLGIEHIHAQWLTTPATVAYVASRLTGVPFSLSGHSHDVFADNLLAEKTARATFVRLISERNRRDVLARLPSALAERCRVVHLGVEVPAVLAQPPARTPRILCPARLCTVKGHRYLLAACAALRDRGIPFSCDLAGDGELRGRLAAEIERLKLGAHVRLLGNIGHQALLEALARGDYDLVVLASIEIGDEHEGIPVALMEAMAAGVTPVATQTGSIAELVVPGTGVLVPERDPGALAAALERLLTSPDLRRRLGSNARGRILSEFETTETTRRLGALLGLSLPARATVPSEVA